MTEASTGVSIPRAVRSWLTAKLPDEAIPSDAERALQVACFWRETLLDVQQADPGMTLLPREADLAAPLVTWAHGQAIVHAPHSTKVLSLGGAPPAEQVMLGLDDRAVVTSGELSFACRYVRPAAPVSQQSLESNELRFYKYLAFSVLGFHALVAMMMVTPIGGFSDGDSVFGDRGHLSRLLITPPAAKTRPDFSRIEEHARAANEAGKVGKVDAVKREAEPSKRRPEGDKGDRDRKQVKAALAGLFGDDGAKGNLFAEGGLGAGLNQAIGGLQAGAAMGDANGVAGLGVRGLGPGGGGGPQGLGGLGAMERGRGRCTVGCGVGLIAGRHHEVEIRSPPRIVGGLDRETILKVVRRHQSEIKFCYESELATHPNLGGKLTIAWTIDPSGAVAQADVAESGLDNANVEACVTQRVRRWMFPEPAGGGVVAVTFPWIFKAAGDDAD